MKEFTVKDLIRYNNPCKSCEGTAQFSLRSFTDEGSSPIKPQLDPVTKKVHFTLQTSYKERLVMVVDIANNNFSIETNSDDAKKSFEEFKGWFSLIVETECKRCRTRVTSDSLEFTDNFIKPVKLSQEDVYLETDTHKYTIYTSHTNKKSLVVVDILNQVTPISPLKLVTRALPLSKFKGRKELLEKLRVLVTFS